MAYIWLVMISSWGWEIQWDSIVAPLRQNNHKNDILLTKIQIQVVLHLQIADLNLGEIHH